MEMKGEGREKIGKTDQHRGLLSIYPILRHPLPSPHTPFENLY